MTYYNNVNPDLFSKISLSARHILEIGCGSGALARAVRARNPNTRYVGVELFPDAANKARDVVDALIVGDIEQPEVFTQLRETQGGRGFDALIFGDVLEHLRDPWRLLTDLRPMIAPGGVCSICIPNVSHWSLLEQQFRGRWDYADAGLLDRTHIRFFTLDTVIDMLSKAGWTTLDAKPRILWPDRTAAALKAFEPIAKTLNLDLAKFQRDLSAFQWVVRAINGSPPKNLSIAALSIRNTAGVNEPRIHHPITALTTEPGVQAVIGEGTISIPQAMRPGIFILHRQFVNQPQVKEHLETLARKGWVLVADMDDDPTVWKEYVESDFYAFRAVHAVTVSTPALAEVFRRWNPNVQVFANSVMDLPQVSGSTPKNGKSVRIFFGALNRKKDWMAILKGVIEAALPLKDRVEFVVIHDREFFDQLPENLTKQFHPTLPQEQYLKELASSDIALLPLLDTPFNRLKSDLKLIECAAAQVVPICSKTVYFEKDEHRDFAMFPDSEADWGSAIAALVDDHEQIIKHRKIGLAYVQSKRMLAEQNKLRSDYYHSLIDQREALEISRQSRLTEIREKGA